jgi:5'-nucleotidase
MEEVCAGIGEIVVVAPAEGQSSVGHMVTTNRPIKVEQIGPSRFKVWGSPADCVRLGITTLCPGAEIVFSGINEGANLGIADLMMSGTLAASREAAFFQRISIAVSHYIPKSGIVDWELAAERASVIVKMLLEKEQEQWTFWSVNLPDAPRSVGALQNIECPLDPNPLNVSYEQMPNGYRFSGDYHSRKRHANHDVETCLTGNKATFTKIRLF